MPIRHLSPLLSLLFVLIWAGYSVPSASAWVKPYGYHKGHGHSHYGYHRSRYDKHYGHHRYGHHKYPRYYRYDRGRYDRYRYRYQHDKYGEPGRHGRSYDAHDNRRKEAEKHSDGYAGSSAGLSRGWEFLRNGDASGALHRFSTAARANPSSGFPKWDTRWRRPNSEDSKRQPGQCAGRCASTPRHCAMQTSIYFHNTRWII